MTRAAQATGEDVDFSRMWTQQGGWLGYLMTAGDSLGAHGMWEGQNRATRYRKVPIPRIWEADVAKDPSAEELDWDKDQVSDVEWRAMACAWTDRRAGGGRWHPVGRLPRSPHTSVASIRSPAPASGARQPTRRRLMPTSVVPDFVSLQRRCD